MRAVECDEHVRDRACAFVVGMLLLFTVVVGALLQLAPIFRAARVRCKEEKLGRGVEQRN